MSFFEDASLVLIPSAQKTSKIYSVKPTDGTGDLTFTRTGDTASRFGPDGLIEKVRTNLVLQSQTFDNASWTKNAGATITANTTIAPDGTTTADTLNVATNVFSGVYQAISSSSNIYTISLFVKKGTKDFIYVFDIAAAAQGWFNLTNGTLGSIPVGYNASITSVGDGWYRISFGNKNAVTPAFFQLGLSDADGFSTPASTGTAFIWGAQTEVSDFGATDYIATTSAAVSVGPVANVPRLDYLNSSCPRLLLEPQRTNLALFSEQFDNAGWTKNDCTISANVATSPDGYANADRVIPSNGLTCNVTQSFSYTAGTSYTISVFVKKESSLNLIGITVAGNASVSFNLDTNVFTTLALLNGWTLGSASYDDYGNGWKRVKVTYVAGTTVSAVTRVAEVRSRGDGTSGILFYGAQFEAGAYATSYIPTLGSASTRGSDAASKTSATALIGQTEGTIFIQLGEMNTAAKDDVWIELSDGTTNNRILIYNDSNGNIRNQIKAAGTIGSLIDSGVTLASGQKIAITYKTNEAKIFINGVQRGGTDTSVVVPAVGNLYLSNFTGTIAQSRTIAQALLFKTALSDADCIALTA